MNNGTLSMPELPYRHPFTQSKSIRDPQKKETPFQRSSQNKCSTCCMVLNYEPKTEGIMEGCEMMVQS